MQFMKNTNIKRAANDSLLDAHKTALRHFSPRRHEYSDALLIDWFIQAYEQLIGSDIPNIQGKKVNDSIRFFLTELTEAAVLRKLKYDPPETEKEFKLIDDQIEKNLHLFYNFKDYLDKKIRTSYN